MGGEMIVPSSPGVPYHCQLSIRVLESRFPSLESYVTKRIRNVLPGVTGMVVRNHPVEP